MNPEVTEIVNDAKRRNARYGRALPPGSTDLMHVVLWAEPFEVGMSLEDPSIRQSINTQNADGMTALMYAAKDGKGDVIEQLKRAGAKTDLKTTAGKTARELLPQGLAPDEQEYLQNLVGGRRRKTRKARKTQRRRGTRRPPVNMPGVGTGSFARK